MFHERIFDVVIKYIDCLVVQTSPLHHRLNPTNAIKQTLTHKIRTLHDMTSDMTSKTIARKLMNHF